MKTLANALFVPPTGFVAAMLTAAAFDGFGGAEDEARDQRPQRPAQADPASPGRSDREKTA